MKQPKEGGFTIVELLMVIIVSAIVIGSLSLIVAAQARLSQRSRDLVAADAFIENKIESLRSKGYLGVNLGTTDITSEMPSELATPRGATLAVTINNVSTKKIVITLNYNDQGVNRVYSYATLIGELGVGQY